MLHEQFEQEHVANSIGMTGSKSKMLQIPLKRQLPAPKCSFQLQNAANSNENGQKKQIQQKKPKTELNNSQNIPKQFWTLCCADPTLCFQNGYLTYMVVIEC